MPEQGQEERKQPEEEAANPGRRREPVSEQSSDETIDDPSGDTDINDEDRDNPLVNDGSFPEANSDD